MVRRPRKVCNKCSMDSSVIIPPEEIGEPGKFGLLMGKNMSLGPWQTVNTGANDHKLISETVAYNGKTHVKV